MFNGVQLPNSSATITPSDTAVISVYGYIITTQTGNLVVKMACDSSSTTMPVVAGVPYWGHFKAVLSTGHTAGTVTAYSYSRHPGVSGL